MEAKEEWRDIPGYEGVYQVSSEGLVKSLNYRRTGREKTLKLYESNHGYFTVGLYLNGKPRTFQVHQLVAIAFLGHERCGHKSIIDHINNKKKDNRVVNLQITTPRHNVSKERESFKKNLTGVSFKSNKWRAAIVINGRNYDLGGFENKRDAASAYKNAVKKWEANREAPDRPVFTSKYKGVYWDKFKGKWCAQYRHKYLGAFSSEIEASKSYERAIKQNPQNTPPKKPQHQSAI